MKKVLLFLAALAWAAVLAAQEIPDLVEIEAPALADSAWQELGDALRAFAQPLRLGGQLFLSDGSAITRLSILYKLERASLQLNQQHDWDSGENHWNGSLFLHSERLSFRLGSQRLRFGRGIVLGNSSRSFSDSLFQSQDPGAPASYVPMGISLQAGGRVWRGALFASLQEREARLSGHDIAGLPTSRQGLFTSTQESIAGLAAGFQSKALNAGLLLYWHQYDRPFADPDLGQKLWALSAGTGLKLPGNRIDAEFAFAHGQPLWLASWQLKLGPLTQTVSHARNALEEQLPYALNASLLDHSSDRSEFNYDLQFRLPWHLRADLRYALNAGHSFSGGALSRLIASLGYQNKGNSAALTLASFDRDVVTLIDSNYVSPDPRNYRIQFTGRYQFKPKLFQQLEFHYSLQDRTDHTQNTYHVRLTMGYELGKILLKAGLLSWQSPRSFIVLDENAPDLYTVCESDDTALFASAGGRFARWQFSLSAQKSLLAAEDFRLNVRCGLSLF